MKQFYTTCIALIVSSVALFAQTLCNNGMAGPYPCNGYDLQSEITLTEMNATKGNDSWGWTDPQTGNEYALVALNNGCAFIDISDPVNPVYLGKLPSNGSGFGDTWRDVKVYQNHAFVVSEIPGHGMQIFDLTRLRNVPNPPQIFDADALYEGFGNAHNIVINEDTGYAYGVGTSTFNGGPHFVNIQDPVNPVAAGGYSFDQYSHDAQVVTYCGPDSNYTGREILIGSNEDFVAIVDITDKENPVGIATIDYANTFYTHQGWFTEDQRFFVLGDEIDELNIGGNTRTIVFDFEDLSSPQLHFIYEGETEAIDHNGYVNGTKYHMANYRAGLRTFDVSDIANGNMEQESFFDTYPNNNSASFNGAWNVYPFFESGNLVISDIERGFILVKASAADTTKPIASCMDTTLSLDENGTATLTVEDINNGSSDNSGTVFFKLCQTEFSCSDLGTNQVELEVYDDFGNRSFCTATVTIEDTQNPIPECPQDFSVGYDEGENFYTLPNFEAEALISATDNCSFTIEQDPAPGTQLTEGTYTVNFVITDTSNNDVACSVTIEVMEILSVADNEFLNGITIYPNPTTNILNITSKSEPITAITLYDISGKAVFQQDNFSEAQKTIDISNVANGMYFLHINNRITQKIVKQ